MAFGYTGGADNNGNSASPGTGTHGLAINSGDLVVVYINSNSTTSVTHGGSEGTAFTSAVDETPASETCRQALFWKVAGSSEPSSYTFSAGNAEWRCIIKVFTSATDAVVDAAAVTHRQGSKSQFLDCGAPNGETVSADSLSVVAGGKDNRNTSAREYDTVDSSFVSPLGNRQDMTAGMAHRIFSGAGTTYTADIQLSCSTGAGGVDGVNDNTYSVHISFVESSGAGTDNLLANDVESASEVSTPALGQTHTLLANDVESASEVSTPALGQVHALLANDVESSSEVSTPTLAESAGTDNLLANDVESTSEVSTPAIGQVHTLLANDVESTSEVSTPAIGQVHTLLANDVESASEVSTPALAEVASGPHNLFAVSIESISTVSRPGLNRQPDIFTYVPQPVPFSTSEQMRQYLENELQKISHAINDINSRE